MKLKSFLINWAMSFCAIIAYEFLRPRDKDHAAINALQQATRELELSRQELRHSQWETEVKTYEATQAINELHVLKLREQNK